MNISDDNRRVREAFRPPTPRERAILELLLSVEMPGVKELRAQLAFITVARWTCGCASFNVLVDRDLAPRSSITAAPVVEATSRERDDLMRAFDLLLWVEDGWLAGVEIVDYVERHGEDSPDEIPPPEQWNQPEPRSPG